MEKTYFDHRKETFVLNKIDEAVLEQCVKNGELSKGKIKVNGEDVKYKSKKKTLLICFKGLKYSIEKKPFVFKDEEGNILGKIYEKKESKRRRI